MSLSEINRDPPRKELRRFGVLLALWLAAIGSLLMWRWGAPVAARWVWSGGGALLLLYLTFPPLRRRIYVGWMFAAHSIGWTVSHLLLGFVYYLVLTPIGLVVRLSGRDPLERQYDPEARSYWVMHQPPEDRSRYFRQF